MSYVLLPFLNTNVCFLDSDNDISQIFSISFNFNKIFSMQNMALSLS